MTIIDGSQHSGSGTIVRYAMALAPLMREPVRITNVRHNRAQPGLGTQHAASVSACAALADGRSSYVVPEVSDHVLSNVWLVSQFGARVTLDQKDIAIDGIALTGRPVVIALESTLPCVSRRPASLPPPSSFSFSLD